MIWLSNLFVAGRKNHAFDLIKPFWYQLINIIQLLLITFIMPSTPSFQQQDLAFFKVTFRTWLTWKNTDDYRAQFFFQEYTLERCIDCIEEGPRSPVYNAVKTATTAAANRGGSSSLWSNLHPTTIGEWAAENRTHLPKTALLASTPQTLFGPSE